MKEELKRDKPKEELIVYEMVRNTIISCEERVRNETIYMYVIYFAMLSFAFENNWLFLVTFIVLISFQSMMYADRLSIEKASAYIQVFFEKSGYNIHWESLNKDPDFMDDYRLRVKTIGWYFDKAGSSILAVISFVSMLVSFLKVHKIDNLTQDMAIELTVGFILCLIVIYMNFKFCCVNDGKAANPITKSVQHFYDKCYPPIPNTNSSQNNQQNP